MDSVPRRSVGPLLVAVAIGVVITLVGSFLFLVLLNGAVEALFYPAANDGGPVYGDPEAPGVPVTALRIWFAVALVALYPFVFATRLTETLKAILLAAPVGVSAAAAGVTLYDKPVLAWSAIGAVALVTAVLLRVARLSWLYYASAMIALVLATAYAWPSP